MNLLKISNMSKPKNECTAVVTCPKCNTSAEVFKFKLDEGAAKWPQTAYHWCNNVCTNLCGTNNGGALTLKVEADAQDMENFKIIPAINTDMIEGKTFLMFNKDQFFEYYYKKMWGWCEVPGCEEKFYKEGSTGHHLCTDHYEQSLKIDAQTKDQNETDKPTNI